MTTSETRQRRATRSDSPQTQESDRPDRGVIEECRRIWKHGYRECDVLDPLGGSTHYDLGYMSVMHAVYLWCIRPYIHSGANVLEIGCGGGAWTKTMLGANEVWGLDAKSAEDNQIYEYLGQPKNLHYIQVNGADCHRLPDGHFDLVFSYGCLCHLPFTMVRDYIHQLPAKLKPGGQGFVMVSDYDKFNSAWSRRDETSIVHRLARSKLGGRRYAPVSLFLNAASAAMRLIDGATPKPAWGVKDKNEDDRPRPARWYDAGVARTCSEIEAAGLEVVCRDLELIARDPMIHFQKPAER